MRKVRRRNHHTYVWIRIFCTLLLFALAWCFFLSAFSSVHSTQRVAVVVPITRHQANERLRKTFSFWISNQPCSFFPSARPYLIIDYCGGLDEDSDVRSSILNAFNSLPWRVKFCFRDIKLWSSRLTVAENVYPVGPCLQFYRAFDKLAMLNIDFWMLYEPDTFPIQPGWISRLLDLTASNQYCVDWWQLGSSPSYKNKIDSSDNFGIDLHLNGNSIYCVNSEGFREYRTLVTQSFPANGCYVYTADDDFAGYDHALYQFRMLKENRQYMQGKFSMFKDDEFIRNFGDSGLDIDKYLGTHPRTMLVHSKYYFVDQQTRDIFDQKNLPFDIVSLLTTIYDEVLHRPPSQGEKDFFSRVFQPFHGDIKTLRCLLNKVTLLAAGQLKDCGNFKFDKCNNEGTLSDIFSSEFEGILTARWITVFHRMPGPEVYQRLQNGDYLNFLRFGRKICHDVWMLSEFAALGPHKNWQMEFESKQQYVSGHSSNNVLFGSYLATCENSTYDPVDDVLSCRLGPEAISMRRPHLCANDISVNKERRLVC